MQNLPDSRGADNFRLYKLFWRLKKEGKPFNALTEACVATIQKPDKGNSRKEHCRLILLVQKSSTKYATKSWTVKTDNTSWPG